ncbi:O-antigen polymerase [Cedecea sp. NFIX57]|uniref:O-antigen polymerase n=1 Tax=Cedecea sp. NFIX57 TaxID=1566286 RepID=UPI000A0BD11B|nr:O-antigen polymerase [Cedecea sp. NFIX57]SMG60151.1 oligosaccharide repeat unit polymerase [Cedecea sp. NFIX57]
MSDTDFFHFIFSNWIEYLLYAVPLTFLCYLTVRRLAVGFIDPIHFYFTFTFGTSYAIVLILWIYDYIPDHIFYMILSNWIVLAAFMRLSFKTRNFKAIGVSEKIFNTCNANSNMIFWILLLTYTMLTTIYVKNVSFEAFIQSRFEANRGLGALVRVLDVVRLLLTAYLSIMAIKSIGFKRWFLAAFAILISVIASFVSGAKFSLLEHLLVALISIYIYCGWKPKLTGKSLVIFVLLAIAMISYVLFLLSFASQSLGYTKANYMDAPVVVELFFMRIFANGDAYYFSLPNSVIDSLHVSNSIYQLFGYIAGNGVMQNVFDYDYTENDVGRLIWKVWYPWDDIARGPTSHFDLAGYAYFGAVGGIIMTAAIGWIIGRICKAKNGRRRNDIFYSSFVSVLYCRTIVVLLSPPVGLAYIVDLIFILIFLTILSAALNFILQNKRVSNI